MNKSLIDLLSWQGSNVHKISDDMLHVSTPHIFSDGSPSVYVASVMPSGRIRLDDQGRNLDLFLGNLPNSDHAERIMARLIKQSSSIIMFDKQQITCESTIADLDLAIGQYVGALSRITTYAPKSIAAQNIDDILALIHDFLSKKYHSVISVNPEVAGHSGVKHHFNFQSGGRLFEFAKPEPQKTGSLLRKIMDVRSAHDELDFQIILDDSNPKHFKREGDILAGVASILPLSKSRIAPMMN
jgi:hypothetical protein